MDNRLNLILYKYDNELKNFIYIEKNNLKDIQPKTRVKYISKNNLLIKNAYFKRYIDINIIELYINSKKIWNIYTENFYFFSKKSNNDILRSALENLVNSNFKIIKKN